MPKQIIDVTAAYQTINTAARISGMSSKWIRAKIKSGDLVYVMVGNEYRVKMSALWKYLDEMAVDHHGVV